jgi:hypothetical protein
LVDELLVSGMIDPMMSAGMMMADGGMMAKGEATNDFVKINITQYYDRKKESFTTSSRKSHFNWCDSKRAD